MHACHASHAQAAFPRHPSSRPAPPACPAGQRWEVRPDGAKCAECYPGQVATPDGYNCRESEGGIWDGSGLGMEGPDGAGLAPAGAPHATG
jgi:hypothetical protein